MCKCVSVGRWVLHSWARVSYDSHTNKQTHTRAHTQVEKQQGELERIRHELYARRFKSAVDVTVLRRRVESLIAEGESQRSAIEEKTRLYALLEREYREHREHNKGLQKVCVCVCVCVLRLPRVLRTRTHTHRRSHDRYWGLQSHTHTYIHHTHIHTITFTSTHTGGCAFDGGGLHRGAGDARGASHTHIHKHTRLHTHTHRRLRVRRWRPASRSW